MGDKLFSPIEKFQINIDEVNARIRQFQSCVDESKTVIRILYYFER